VPVALVWFRLPSQVTSHQRVSQSEEQAVGQKIGMPLAALLLIGTPACSCTLKALALRSTCPSLYSPSDFCDPQARSRSIGKILASSLRIAGKMSFLRRHASPPFLFLGPSNEAQHVRIGTRPGQLLIMECHILPPRSGFPRLFPHRIGIITHIIRSSRSHQFSAPPAARTGDSRPLY